MNREQIASFCERYFSAAGCTIIEKTPVWLHVKLSPEADRELTGRDYYWNFVERTGAEPETMSFKFILDPEAYEREKAKAAHGPGGPSAGGPGAGATGAVPSVLAGLPPVAPRPGRTLEEPLVFGSRRLDQLFASACRRGACLQLFEEPSAGPSPFSRRYATWLGVNYKISFVCDRKREELMSLGIHLSTGEIADDFFARLERRRLAPLMPAGTMLGETISLERAARQLEQHVLGRLAGQNHDWAGEARRRLAEEEERVIAYFEDRLADAALSPEEREAVIAQRGQRLEEIRWQHEPRIEVQPVNYGLFHLWTDTFRPRSR